MCPYHHNSARRALDEKVAPPKDWERRRIQGIVEVHQYDHHQLDWQYVEQARWLVVDKLK